MTQPPQLDIAEVSAEMEREPLSKALWENAQLRLMLRKQIDLNRVQAERIAELESQREADRTAMRSQPENP